MNHNDAELSDVLVVLDAAGGKAMDVTLQALKDAGLMVSEVNNDQGIVEGNIATDSISRLKGVPGVGYVRNVLSYIADFPTGDPRDRDGACEDCEDDD